MPVGKLRIKDRRADKARAEHSRAVEHARVGRHAQAEPHYRKSLAILETASAWNDLGISLMELGRPKEAWPAYQAAMRLKPKSCAPYVNGAVVALRGGYVGIAAELADKAKLLDPTNIAARANLAVALHEMGAVEESLVELAAALSIAHAEGDSYTRGLDLDASAVSNGSTACMIANYSVHLSEEQIAMAHMQWYARNSDALGTPFDVAIADPRPDRPLRIGYLSSDFRRHSVAYFAEPLIEYRNGEDYEVTCYSAHAIGDEVRDRIKGKADRWRDVYGMPPAQLCAQIITDRIDILVDLGGHTGDNNLRVVARKPAPIVVTYLGYPNTTGLPAVDYRLVDEITDPPGLSDRLCTETLVRLPGGFLAYRPDRENSPEVGMLPYDRNGYITFGSCNNLAKVSQVVWKSWAELLRQVPDARLLVKSRVLHDQRCVEYVTRTAEAAGIDLSRLDLRPPVESPMEHLQVYNEIDIALDSFPYNGTTTTFEALWMGCPVITLAGRTHCGRVGASILTRTGLKALVTTSPEDYVRVAMELAQDRQDLLGYREGMRERLEASPMLDGRRLVREIEAEYRAMWRARVGG